MRHALRNLLVVITALIGVAAAQGVNIVLPDGATCTAVGPAVNVSVAGGQVSHFCDAGVALVGELLLVDDYGLVTRVAYDPNAAQTIYDDALVVLEVKGVTLANGATCLHAGEGATLAFEGERANFTCDDDGVLLGYFEASGADVYATRGAVTQGAAGLNVSGKEHVLVQTIDASNPITNVQWTLVSFGVDGTPAISDAPATLTITDGQAAGTTGCNRYFAGAAFGLDGAVGFGAAGSTMMFCEGAMEQEQRYLTTLSAAESYSITDDGQLVLSGAEGDLVFSR
ncbi:MAG TPA: META domain-containing protein [Trueperaceae bacterium]|nr:META domain-containing protein [Trueperaceae bacterium]